MTAIRQVETFVAEREIGDLLIPQRQRQPHPVVERRIYNFVMRKFSRSIGNGHMTNFAAPAFGQRHYGAICRQWADFREHRTYWQRFQLIEYKRYRPLYFNPPHLRPGENIAGVI